MDGEEREKKEVSRAEAWAYMIGLFMVWLGVYHKWGWEMSLVVLGSILVFSSLWGGSSDG